MKAVDEVGIKRLDDGRLHVRTTAKCPETGKMLYATRTMQEGATVAEAVLLRESLRENLREPARAPDLGPQIITLADYSTRWVERKTRRGRWRPKTIQKNVKVLSRHVLPQLGHIRLDRLTRRDVSDWIAWAERQQRRDGKIYSTSTVKSWWSVFRNLLRDAFAQGYIENDITQRHETPDTGVRDRQEKRTLSGEDVGKIVDLAKRTLCPQRYAEIATLAFTGMRPGELYALHWEDLDGEFLHIKKSVWEGSVSPPKNGRSRRVPIPGLVATALDDHRQQMIRDQHRGLSTGIIFPSRGGKYRHTQSLAKPLRLLREHLGIEQRVTPQVFRRTFNTLLLKAKTDRITIRSMTGHSSEEMTEHYADIPGEMKTAALGTLLGNFGIAWDQEGHKTADQ